MSKSFSRPQHDRLLSMLSASDFTQDYVSFCGRYMEEGDLDGPHVDLEGVSRAFEAIGVQCDLIKRYKVFEFDHEDIAGWTWKGSLVVKRYDMLEPMFEGSSLHADEAVGSTMLIVARQSGALKHPPVVIQGGPRPKFDGDMRTMERMIPDLVRLFRSMKDVIRDC